jgi:hypothetical protein
VTINQTSGQADPTSASPINFTVTFSEPVTGYTAICGQHGERHAHGGSYRHRRHVQRGSLRDDRDRQLVVSVSAGAVTDPAGNASLASTSTDNTVAYNPVAVPISFVQMNAATPQTNQSTVTVSYASAQTVGYTNILAVGWNNTTSNITRSPTRSATRIDWRSQPRGAPA